MSACETCVDSVFSVDTDGCSVSACLESACTESACTVSACTVSACLESVCSVSACTDFGSIIVAAPKIVIAIMPKVITAVTSFISLNRFRKLNIYDMLKLVLIFMSVCIEQDYLFVFLDITICHNIEQILF